MFSIKQVGENQLSGSFEKIWPNVAHIDARGGVLPDTIECVSAFFTEGGSLDFRRGESTQTIYVMNEKGSTVARYALAGDSPVSQLNKAPSPQPVVA